VERQSLKAQRDFHILFVTGDRDINGLPPKTWRVFAHLVGGRAPAIRSAGSV
jgi:hypothetical protein